MKTPEKRLKILVFQKGPRLKEPNLSPILITKMKEITSASSITTGLDLQHNIVPTVAI
jgi:hypothetical protein